MISLKPYLEELDDLFIISASLSIPPNKESQKIMLFLLLHS